MLVQLAVTDPARRRRPGKCSKPTCSRSTWPAAASGPIPSWSRSGTRPAARPATITVSVSPLLAEAVAVSLRAARLTDGDVDPTVGGVLAELG